jgi:hypothetical protein
MARHGIHVSEVLAVSIQTLEAMQRSQAAIHKILELDKPYCDRTDEYTDFQIRTLKSLNLRSESNNKRISNEIALVSLLRILKSAITADTDAFRSHSTALLILITPR